MAWGDKVGTPLAGGVHVPPEGAAASTNEVVGFELAKAHPHLNMPGGCTIEVHGAQPVPGM